MTIDWDAVPDRSNPTAKVQVSDLLPTAQPAVKKVVFPYLPGKPKRGVLQLKVEQFFRERNIPYVSVDDAKRALFASTKLGSFHFVSYNKTGPNWLIWAAQIRKQTRDDMQEWEKVFGEGFIAVVAKENGHGQLSFKTLGGEPVEVT